MIKFDFFFLTEPGSAPRNVQVRPLSSSTMVIQWDEPEANNGQVTVKYMKFIYSLFTVRYIKFEVILFSLGQFCLFRHNTAGKLVNYLYVLIYITINFFIYGFSRKTV